MRITVPVETLLKSLEENLAAHIKDRDEARANYKAKAIEVLDKMKAKVEAGEVLDLYKDIRLTPPVDNEDKYNTAIGMLKMHTEQEVVLDYEDYRNYIEDNWEWARIARTSNSYYK